MRGVLSVARRLNIVWCMRKVISGGGGAVLVVGVPLAGAAWRLLPSRGKKQPRLLCALAMLSHAPAMLCCARATLSRVPATLSRVRAMVRRARAMVCRVRAMRLPSCRKEQLRLLCAPAVRTAQRLPSRMIMATTLLLCALGVMIFPGEVESQALSSVSARVSLGPAINSISTNIDTVQIAPVLEAIGVGVELKIVKFLTFAPFLDISLNDVSYSSQTRLVHPRAFVDDLSTGHTTILTFYLGIPLVFTFDIGTRFNIGLGVSPTLLFRVPVDGAEQQRIGVYYIRQGRFFYPEAHLNIGYKFQDVELLVSGRVLTPIYNLWDNDGSPFAHDIIFFVTTHIRFLLSDPIPVSENPSVSARR